MAVGPELLEVTVLVWLPLVVVWLPVLVIPDDTDEVTVALWPVLLLWPVLV